MFEAEGFKAEGSSVYLTFPDTPLVANICTAVTPEMAVKIAEVLNDAYKRQQNLLDCDSTDKP